MRLTYDREADAAYLTVVDRIQAGEAAHQVGAIETPNGTAQIVLDFDAAGGLLGVEILAASTALSAGLLAAAPSP